MVQFDDPDYEGGANELSLNECKANFRQFGAVDQRFLRLVRKPLDSERNPKRKDS